MGKHLTTTGVMADKHVLSVVKNLDVVRYMGVWHEIARIPSGFQPKDVRNTTATYTLEDPSKGLTSRVKVYNSGMLPSGKEASIEGWAWKNNTEEEVAKFSVRFWVPPFLPLFPVTGAYWVIDLDVAEYQWAVVGEPRRQYCWILCREKTMQEELYSGILQRLQDQGYNTDQLVKTIQEAKEEDGDGKGENGEEKKKEEGAGETKRDGGWWWLRSMFDFRR